MFCSKCGSKSLEGAEFCQKCGARLMADEAISQTTATPQHEPIASASTITEDTQQAQSNNATKVNGGLRKVANIGRVLLGISLLLLLLCSFFSLPINPIIVVGGVAIGTILSALGLKRPLGMTKIIELVVACILLVAAIAYAVSFSSGGGDKYVQLVRGGILDGYPQKTVGEVFDDFLDNPKWESGVSEDGERFVNVKGRILYFDKEAELAVQFIVDEKNGTFQYNACEIDGAPQNNFVFWNLLESIYNDDSALPAPTPQSNLNSGMIGDTQSYNNEFGNIEVTLDYVEFVDKLEDTQTGNDIYPDEDCVFLRAGVTVENVGTEKGGLVTGWNKIVYDSKYEFVEYFNPMEVDLTNIKPLSPPKNGALIFTVPNSVAESDKSLVLNINDVSGKPLISYVLRPTGGTITATNTSGENVSESVAVGEILYKDIPVSSFFDTLAIDVAYAVGLPEGADRDDDIRLYIFPERSEVESAEVWNTSALTVNGISLNKNRDGLIDIFGQPIEEGNDGSGYFMRYHLPDCSLYFELGEPGSEAWRILISPNAATETVSSEVLYMGVPVMELLETPIDDVTAWLGEPTSVDNYLQGYAYEYNNEILFILDANKRDISWIEISPEALTAGDVSLDKDRAFLIKTFGEPTEEYIDEMTREYTISYNMKKYALAFILPDSNSKVSKITIHFSGQ